MAFIVLAVVVLTRRRKKRGIVPLTLTYVVRVWKTLLLWGGKHSGAQSDVLFVFQKWSMSCVHMSGKKQLWHFTIHFTWCVILFKKHIFLFRGNAASASEITVDCTELRCCNEEPPNSGTANEQCLMWQEKRKISTCLWPTLLNKLQTSKTTYWRRKAWPKTAIWVSGVIHLLSGREPWHLSRYLLYYWYLLYSELDGKLWKWKWNFWDAAGRSRADTGGVTGGWRERGNRK